MGAAIRRLDVGVKKLNETNSVVATLQADITRMQPILATKTKETEALLIQVNKDRAEADEKKVVADEDAKKAAEAEAVLQAAKEEQAKVRSTESALARGLSALDESERPLARVLCARRAGAGGACAGDGGGARGGAGATRHAGGQAGRAGARC